MTDLRLTQFQVNNLKNGTRIFVTWDGGNGPHEYVYRDGFAFSKFDDTRAGGSLDFVGHERYHQHVWLAEDNAE